MSGERYIYGVIEYTKIGVGPKPIGMNNKCIGGSDFNTLTKGLATQKGVYVVSVNSDR
jgi:hypothetical protein